MGKLQQSSVLIVVLGLQIKKLEIIAKIITLKRRKIRPKKYDIFHDPLHIMWETDLQKSRRALFANQSNDTTLRNSICAFGYHSKFFNGFKSALKLLYCSLERLWYTFLKVYNCVSQWRYKHTKKCSVLIVDVGIQKNKDNCKNYYIEEEEN